MAVELHFGKSIAGLLVDGVKETPYTGATLTMEDDGIKVTVPFIHHGGDQFKHVDEWFDPRSGEVPKNMTLQTPEGDINLYDVRWQGTSIRAGVSSGQLMPMNSVVGSSEAPLADPLLITSLRSHVDGLREFSLYTAISHDSVTDERGLVQKVNVTISSGDGISWQQGEVTMQVQTDWKTENPEDRTEGRFTVLEWTTLTSTFPAPRSVEEHLEEQRKFIHFMACVVYSRGIYFRKHFISSEAFPQRIGSEILNYPYRELVSRHTVAEYGRKKPSYELLRDPLVRIEHAGPDALKKWSDSYEEWESFISPLVGLFNRTPTLPEDFVVTCAIAMEKAGHILGEQAGERATYREDPVAPTTSTWIFRCLVPLGLDWSPLGTDAAGIASLIARQYNGTKHYRKGKTPDEDQLMLAAMLCRLVVQLLCLWIADPTGALNAKYATQDLVVRYSQELETRGITVSDAGFFVAAPTPEP